MCCTAAVSRYSSQIERVRCRGRYYLFRLNVLDVAVVDAFVVPQRVQAAVDPFANVADGLAGRPHVNVLYVPFEPGQRGQALVARLASELFHT